MTIEEPLCFKCKHYCHNHGDGSGYGCRAFPTGIPDEAKLGYNHHSVINGQVGNFVYEETSYENLPPFGKYLWDNQ